jgi:hypothetical protein
LLDHALDIACSIAEPFVVAPSDVPLRATALVLSSGASDDPDAVLRTADRLKELPAVSVVTIDLIARTPQAKPSDLLSATASDAERNPNVLGAVPLIQHVKTGRALDGPID